MQDWRGTELKVGSIVVYPGRHSSGLWMNEGVVEQIIPHQTEEPYDPGTYKPRSDYCRRCVHGARCLGVNLKVRITESDLGVRKDRLSTLTAVERVTVVG